jgi:hypothetical protein
MPEEFTNKIVGFDELHVFVDIFRIRFKSVLMKISTVLHGCIK